MDVQIQGWAILATGWATGLIAGSTITMIAARGPIVWKLTDREGPATFWGRSQCAECGAQLTWRDLVPLASYFVSGGRARCCGAAIPGRYPVIEFCAGIIGVASVWRFGVTADAAFAAALGWIALSLAAIDARDGVLPDALTGPLLWLGLIANLADRFAPLASAVIGAAVGYVALRAIEETYRLLRGRDGLGRGDAKLLAAFGAILGWERLPFLVLGAALAALAVALATAVVRRRSLASNAEIAFGPYLVAAGLALLFAPV